MRNTKNIQKIQIHNISKCSFSFNLSIGILFYLPMIYYGFRFLNDNKEFIHQTQ